jgi:hypothetical protein
VTKNEVVQRLQEIRRVASEVRNLINSGAPGDKVHETIAELGTLTRGLQDEVRRTGVLGVIPDPREPVDD